jgi:hypothetical protein
MDSKLSSGHALLLAAFVGLSAEPCEAQLVGLDNAEILMRESMPTTARCERLFGEALSYCRYQTVDSTRVVFELSFGADGPAGSLTYNVGDPEGRRLLIKLRRFFVTAGAPETVVKQCINRSRSKSSEVLAGNFRIHCRYADLADRVAYEIFVEPQKPNDSSRGGPDVALR